MDAPYWNGDDHRDELTEPDPPDCPDCGVRWDELCEPNCLCVYCALKRMKARAQTPGDAA